MNTVHTDFAEEYSRYKALFEGYLKIVLNEIHSPDSKLLEAVRYALSVGGKRLRPVLFLAIYDYFSDFSLLNNTNFYKATRIRIASNLPDSLQTTSMQTTSMQTKPTQGASTQVASTLSDSLQSSKEVIKLVSVAIEALHSYTLVHDDLPCLDNDDFRRGQPSCHKKFGEATALLAGDALLNLSFELLLKAAAINPLLIDGIGQFAILTGVSGLIGGQAKELTVTQANNLSFNNVSEGMLLDIYKNKTASLFEAAALMGGECAGCDKNSLSLIKDFAQSFGISFQLKDDLDDMDKNSFAQIFGRERTLLLLNNYLKKARDAAHSMRYQFIEKFIDFEKYI